MIGRLAELQWRGRSVRSPVVWLSALLVLVLAGWAGVSCVSAALKPSGCERRIPVQVAAAPSIAAAVTQIAERDGGRGGCVDITVVAKDSAAFAEALANPPPGSQPHAWLPDSTYWLGRAQAKGAFAVPDRGTSVATSPVVLGMTEPVALQLGWPAKPVPWSALLTPTGTIPVGLPDPATDPVGVAALIGLQAITSGQPQARTVQTAVMRRLTRNTVTRNTDLYERLPEAGSAATTLNAFVTTEQSLLRHNAKPRVTPLVAAYAEAAIPTLDFPYVVLPGAGRPQLDGATRFLAALLSPEGRRILGGYGLRGPDGALNVDGPLDPSPSASRVRSDTVAPVPMPDEAELVPVLSAWTGVHLSARILGVLDISGSMAERLPGGETRLGATLKAMQDGVGLLLDTTELGFWVFSTRLDGDRDYRVLAPPRPLGEQRAALVGQLGQVRVKPDGDTGLYDTALAAYTDARRNWIPGRINLVMIATDGRNDDATSISRAQLLAELGKLSDPRRPLPILFIGIGAGIDAGELNEIATATGGKVFLAPDPSGIRQIFFAALADLGCQPPSCRR